MPKLLIACDFDGTITAQDTLVEILDHYGSADWRRIQAQVVAGTLSIRQGLQAEMGSVRAEPEALTELLSNRITLEPTFPDFLDSMRDKGIHVVVLTGGFDLCVETVLRARGLWPVPSLTNRLIRNNGAWKVEFPFPSTTCRDCGHCKADPIRRWNSEGYTTCFVGNGVTDRCPAKEATVTFAKDELLTWCRREGVPAVPFNTFRDIQAELERRQWL